MFSVIIPLYNKEKHIKATLRTVLCQSFQEFEIIVVDDGSKDRGAEIVKELNSVKIRLIRQKNQGVSVARNRGVYEARYSYLVFLDADDGLMPEYLSEMKSLIEDYPDAGIYASNFHIHKYITEELIPRNIDFLPERSVVDDYFYHLSIGRRILACVSTIKKDVFKKTGGFYPGMIRGQDTHLLTRIMLKEHLAFLNKPLYYYTIGSDNQATNTYRPSKIENSLLDYLGVKNKFADIFIIEYSLNRVQNLIQSGYKNEAISKLEKIKKYTPDHLEYILEARAERINEMMRTPIIYFRAKSLTIKLLIDVKDRLLITAKNFTGSKNL